MPFFIYLVMLIVSSVLFAQDPCAGIVPSGYDDAKQQAFLQNYFATSFMLTPNGPVMTLEKRRATVGIELKWLPFLTCTQRYVKLGAVEKYENTNLSPVLPRPRLTVRLPNAGPIGFEVGVAFIPPIPLPFGTIEHVAGEFSAGWQSDFGLRVGGRGHLGLLRFRGLIATPFPPAINKPDDLFWATMFGGDIGIAYRFSNKSLSWLTPYAWGGYGGVHTFFYVGADGPLLENATYPWFGANVAAGAQAMLFDEHLQIVLEASSSIPVFTTVGVKLAYVW